MLIVLVTAALLVPVATAAAQQTPMSEIRQGHQTACKIILSFGENQSTKAQRARACVRAWRCTTSRLTDRQIRIWHRDVTNERKPVRYQGVVSGCITRNDPDA